MKLIAGDIGGTKTIIGLYTPEGGPSRPVFEEVCPSGSYGSLQALVREFTSRHGIRGADHAVFGVAGPVVGDRARITNLPWEIDARVLREEFGIGRVRLINDLQALAYGIPLLPNTDLLTIQEGRAEATGPIAVIAAGTGLGQAYLTWEGSRYLAHASEGGHTEFGPSNGLELELLEYLMERFGHVSYERVCSGSGIPNIYAFLRERGGYEEPAWLAGKLAQPGADPTALIVEAATAGDEPCGICRQTLAVFLSVLGAEAGNLALKILATGGVYLGGGIPPRLTNVIPESPFMDSFLRKGRLSEIMGSIPVRLILNPRTGLVGAAHFGLDIMDTLP